MVAKRSANELSEARFIGGTIQHQGHGPDLTQATQPFLAHGHSAETWQRQWGVMQQPAPTPPRETVQALHKQWLQWMQTELAAKWRVNVSPVCGTAFAFRTTTPLAEQAEAFKRVRPLQVDRALLWCAQVLRKFLASTAERTPRADTIHTWGAHHVVATFALERARIRGHGQRTICTCKLP
jgi:hypothetical protein